MGGRGTTNNTYNVTVTVDAKGADLDEGTLTEMVMRKMAPALAAAKRQHDRSMGAL